MIRIISAHAEEYLEQVRELFKEYEATLGISLCFENFAKELAGLPGDYALPSGRLYLALEGSEPVGCVALRKISDEVCEMKRLYVRPLARGKGVGRRLVLRLVADARRTGYRRLRLHTLPVMKRAIALYRSMGFKPIEPYRENPVEGAIFLEMTL